jgi:hypothetical protein
MKKSWAAVFLVPMLLGNASAATDSLDKLADDFWTWRSKYAPFTGDDVNRMERPGGIRDWSKASIETRRKDLAGFETRWKDRRNPLADPPAGRLPADRLGVIARALGTRYQSPLETRPEFLHRANAHPDR